MKLVPALLLTLACFASSDARADDIAVTTAKLRQHCKGCHAVGGLRFIWTDSDTDTWNYIFDNISPKSKRPWAELIVKTLDWPSDTPPDFGTPMSAQGDWMPQGVKRLHFADDRIDGVSVVE